MCVCMCVMLMWLWKIVGSVVQYLLGEWHEAPNRAQLTSQTTLLWISELLNVHPVAKYADSSSLAAQKQDSILMKIVAMEY